MRRGKIEICKSKPFGTYYYRVKGGNGKILCHSEVYCSKQMCERGVTALIRAMDLPYIMEKGEKVQ